MLVLLFLCKEHSKRVILYCEISSQKPELYIWCVENIEQGRHFLKTTQNPLLLFLTFPFSSARLCMSTSRESDLHSLPSSDTNTLITSYKYTYSFYAKRKPRKGIHQKRAGYTQKTNRSAVD